MIHKIQPDVASALAGIADGATVMIGGFGLAGQPQALIDGLIEQGARDLVVVANNAGNGDGGLARLIQLGRVRKIICSFPRQSDSHHFDRAWRAGQIELELVHRATWPNASAPPGPASAPSTPPPAMAPRWPRARRRASSTAAGRCWSGRSTPMSPSSRPNAATAGATSPIE